MPLFRVDLGQLSRIRDFVADTATDLGVDGGALDDLRLAVDEAVTNIIVHGYGGAGEISLDLEPVGRDLVIHLADSAPAFNPTTRAVEELQPLDERSEPGGLGIYLINRAMDEICYKRCEGKNVLLMTKRDVLAP